MIDHHFLPAPLDVAASRRASTFMIALGILLLVAGGLWLATPLLPGHELDARAEEFRSQSKDFFAPGATTADVRRFLIRASIGIGSLFAGLGAIQVWLGLLVRQGNRTAAATGVGLNLVLLAGAGALAAVALATGNFGVVFILLIPGTIIAVQAVQLMNALREPQRFPGEVNPQRHGGSASGTPPPLPLGAQLPPGEAPVFDYNFAAAQKLPPPPAAPAR